MEEHLNKIRVLESSGGRNDGCIKKGLINGYGYAQSTFRWECYRTPREVRNKVETWFETRLAGGYTLSMAVCYYNTGHKINKCPYWQKYQSL
jgi:hypothetical protein